MQHLTKLFQLVELTRSQPQYGYIFAGIPKEDLSDLAQHQYLVTFIAWQLARSANLAGAKLNVEKVMEYALVHDLGELFGGDISMLYARVNKKAYRLAKAFEDENQRYLSNFFGDDKKHFRDIGKEILDPKSDEALVAKIADHVEATHFKMYANRLTAKDLTMAKEKFDKLVKKPKDPALKKFVREFTTTWLRQMAQIEKNEINLN